MQKFVFRPFNHGHLDASDFGIDGMEKELAALDGVEITQISLETDGYYNITLANGIKLDAISIIHIKKAGL